MTDDQEQLTNDIPQIMAFLQCPGGATSITMGLLSIHGRPCEPNDFPRDDRKDVEQLIVLCSDLGRDASGITYLNQLLDLQDAFVRQGRRVYPSQIAAAQALNRQFCEWIFATFPEELPRAEE